MTDQMVLATQQWLNKTYRSKTGFGSVPETGRTGWDTINALIRALQIELGITATANNFGYGTQAKFKRKWPNGIAKNSDTHNVHGIIQGALWCKGYPAEYGGITTKFSDSVAKSISQLKGDIGFAKADSTVDLELMMALLSMKQFRLLSDYGGKASIRSVQKTVNLRYKAYTGIVPTDGLYGREMNTALIQVLQAIEGFTPGQATGNFGNGTRSRLQTISGGSGEWVWLASVALICNGYLETPTRNWSSSLSGALVRFQNDYALPATGVADPTTWMSLLTSKGDPNRACVACDTRFEITDELAGYLKADGYQIVGRYLSEPGQEGLSEKDYFKALRTGELQRIVDHGLQYFPIFQEYSTELRHFTSETGKRHAAEAGRAASRLGIPATVIYFAVDYDATDPEVTSNILPYFRAVAAALTAEYRVGIYASRNICQRVIEAGYAVSAFVSDMSTGFSGNLGFPLPDKWNYDQFHEIRGYAKRWDIDRVAYSGRIGAVSCVKASSVNPEPPVSYQAPPIPNLENVKQISRILPFIRRLENAYMDYRNGFIPNHEVAYFPDTVADGVLKYLAGDYLKNWKFSISASTSFDARFSRYLISKDPSTAERLDEFIGSNRASFTDPNKRGKNDLAHLAYTLFCYLNTSLSPDHWTGWAGDLATGMSDLHQYMQSNPDLNLSMTANALIGSDPEYPAPYFLEHKINTSNVGVRCNFTDICDDADAIILASLLKKRDKNGIRSVSETLDNYYADIEATSRYGAYSLDGLDYSSVETLKKSVWTKMNGFLEGIPKGLLSLAGNSSSEEREACVKAFASYLFARSR